MPCRSSSNIVSYRQTSRMTASLDGSS
jgi:hypothetical protein